MRQPGQMIALKDLEEGLEKEKVNLLTVDMADVLRVLDPYNRRCIFAPELQAAYDSYKKKFGNILAKLSDNLAKHGLSSDELFARAAHTPVGVCLLGQR